MTQSTMTMEGLFELLGCPYQQLEVDKPIDVRSKRQQVLSWGPGIVWKDVLQVVRKADDAEYVVCFENGGISLLSVSPLHQFYAKILGNEAMWIEAMKLEGRDDVQVFYQSPLASHPAWERVSVYRSGNTIPVLDIEVADTHCYFTGGVLSHNTIYGDPMTTPGGKAVPYHASVRIRLTRSGTEKEGADKDKEGDEARGKGEVVGVNTTAKLVKNRLGPPLRKCKFFISFATGVQNEESWFDFLHEREAIKKNAGWCTFPEFQPVIRDYWIAQAVETHAKLDKEQDPVKQKELAKLAKGFEDFADRCMPRVEDKEKKVAKQSGWQFRESAWIEMLNDTPGLKPWVLKKLDELLVVRYGAKPADAELDEESLMEVEQFTTDLINPQ